MRKLILSVTKKDCRWDYYRGSGAGGQKKNKTENCVRCTHVDSNAVGKSEKGKSKERNKKIAFRKMAQSDIFRKWIYIKASFNEDVLRKINDKISKELDDPNITKIEFY